MEQHLYLEVASDFFEVPLNEFNCCMLQSEAPDLFLFYNSKPGTQGFKLSGEFRQDMELAKRRVKISH